MRMARKKALVVEAYRLGEKSPEIEALMKEGNLFSRGFRRDRRNCWARRLC